MSVLCAVALVAACEVAHAQGTPAPATGDASLAPPYTLEVDTDAPDVVSYDALSARIASDLGGAVARPPSAAGRAAITVRYRSADKSLTVRASHVGGRVLERTVKAEGDPASVQREAVLLAGNLARDEARELLDAMAARKANEPMPKQDPKKPEPKKAEPEPDDGYQFANLSLAYPVATNAGRPNIRTSFDVSLLYGRVASIAGVQLSSLVSHASRNVDGLQISALWGIAGREMSGIQIGAAGTYAGEDVSGAQIAGGVNVAGGNVVGTQIAPVDVATKDFSGLQLGVIDYAAKIDGAQVGVVDVAGDVSGLQLGVVNVGKKVKGLQFGVVNVAEEVDGAAIGVVSISKNSIHPIVWTSNLGYANAGFKFTTKYIYTVIAASVGTVYARDPGDGMSTITALGGHIPLFAGFDVDAEAALESANDFRKDTNQDNNLSIHGRILPGYNFAPHLRVFVGGGIQAPLIVEGQNSKTIKPEFMAGVQF